MPVVVGAATQRTRTALRLESINFATLTNYDVAAAVVQRRSQEVLAKPLVYTVYASRAARYLIPGQAFFYEGIDELLRVNAITVEQFTGRVKIEAYADFYGIESSGVGPATSGNTPASATTPVADLAQALLEVPAGLVAGAMAVGVLRIRDNTQIRFADIHLSEDGTTYTRKATEFYSSPGGDLTSALTAADDYYLAQGPTFDALGPDIANALDLSATADEGRWRSGEQLALIGSELFFVRNITALGGVSYRLDGLLRARYRTARAAHSIGADVFLFGRADVLPIEDLRLQPEANLYVKAQPVANTALSLASVTALTKLPLYGYGVRPEPVGNLEAVAPHASPSYEAGDDVTVQWLWAALDSSPLSGFGESNYNKPIGQTTLQGVFELEVRTLADAVVRTVTGLTSPTYTYDNADLQSDLGSEVSFKVVVRHRLGGLTSTDVELTITKV